MRKQKDVKLWHITVKDWPFDRWVSEQIRMVVIMYKDWSSSECLTRVGYHFCFRKVRNCYMTFIRVPKSSRLRTYLVYSKGFFSHLSYFYVVSHFLRWFYISCCCYSYANGLDMSFVAMRQSIFNDRL